MEALRHRGAFREEHRCTSFATRRSPPRPAEVAESLAAYLDAPAEPLAAALGHAHASSVGRYRRDLDERQLADVEAEAGALLRELGYTER